MKKKLTKKSTPKSEFFDLDLVLENAAALQNGKFYSSTYVCENGKFREESVFSQDGQTIFSYSNNGKPFKFREHKNGKWS